MQNALITDANTPKITTDELTIQCFKAQWATHIEAPRVQYKTQLQDTETLREQQRQEEADTERLAAAEQQEKEKELAKEAEKKHLPIQLPERSWSRLDPTTASPIHQEDDDRTKERSKDSLDTNHLQFAMEDGDTLSGSTVSLVGSHTVRASPNAIPDSRLSWPQVM
ncbi:hypothetical protein EV368DRAFT_67437 [Lentinula lateritia]|nr:hypothetical protein EV368DRAFT_67437 [Lentinula lateritia]